MAKKKGIVIPLEQRKQLVSKEDKEFSVTQQCALLGINRSTLYYTSSSMGESDLRICAIIDQLYIEDPTRGTRRIVACLKKKGIKIGRYKTRTLMRHMRLKTVYCKPRTTISDPKKYKYPYLLRNLAITRPNQVWGIDISYIPMPKGYMYLFAIIDLYSRYIVGWSLSNTMEAEWVVKTIEHAIQTHGKPEIINSDQGTQFTSELYINTLKEYSISISMDGKGRATDNAFIERFFRTIKYDKIYLEVPTNPIELHDCCEEFIQFYNNKREHQELKYDCPIDIYRSVA